MTEMPENKPVFSFLPNDLSATKGAWQRAARSPNALPRRRFDRTIGFWLGGALLGVGGCILGSCMPYRHPVAVTISVLWWGLYLGCLGASIGALLGLWAEQTPAPPPQRSDGVGKPRAGRTARPSQTARELIRQVDGLLVEGRRPQAGAVGGPDRAAGP